MSQQQFVHRLGNLYLTKLIKVYNCTSYKINDRKLLGEIGNNKQDFFYI